MQCPICNEPLNQLEEDLCDGDYLIVMEGWDSGELEGYQDEILHFYCSNNHTIFLIANEIQGDSLCGR
jgi:hypothetical protein